MKELLLLLYYVHVCYAQTSSSPESKEQTPNTDSTKSQSHSNVANSSDAFTADPNATTITLTPEPTTVESPVFTEFDFNKHFNVSAEKLSEKELEDLTAQAFASIANRTEKDQEEEGQVYDWWQHYWENFNLKTLLSVEYLVGIGHVETHDQKLKTCYFIGVTYKNAITDIKKYYPIRYLYVKNLRYEVGYLVEEIIVHYQIAVELYHLMVRKYGLKRYRFYAPTTYMLYIYTNILHQCKTIIHLCNMLHELEGKYKNHPDTIFEDYHIPKQFSPEHQDHERMINRYNERLLMEKKMRMREQKKARKKLFKSGVFHSTPRQRRPKKGPFELHYGWSIEYW